jgi:hypothetical protein
MTLSRITTWVDGQVLTAAALNNEFDNLINNPVTLVFPLPAGSGAVDFNYNPVDKFVVGTNNNTTVVGGLSQVIGLLLWNDGSTRSRLMGPSAGVSRVRGLTGSLISNIASFAADGGYQLQRSVLGGNIGNELLTNVSCTSSFSINTQTAGPIAGGRDQAAAFASTDIHYYAVIQTHGSTQIFGICSSTPPPVGPTGFGYWAYLGSAKYSTGSSAISANATQRGSRVLLDVPRNLMTVAGSTTVSITSAATQPNLYIPRTATHQLIRPRAIAGAYNVLGAVDIEVNFYPSSSGTPSEYYRMIAQGPASAGQSQTLTQTAFLLPVVESTPLLYYDASVNTGLSVSFAIDAVGYIVANGDN